MSFLAKLYINDRVINVLECRISFTQSKDITNKPVGRIQGGQFTVVIEMDSNTDILHQMMAQDQMIDGYLRFFKRDGMSKLYDYEFWDCHVAGFKGDFTSQTTKPMTAQILFSPGVLRIGDAVHKKPWHVTDIDAMEVEPTPAPDQLPKIIDYYMTDANSTRIEQADIGDIVLLKLRTRYAIGKKMDINLENPKVDYLYGGVRLENDTISDYIIESDDETIELEVVAPLNEAKK